MSIKNIIICLTKKLLSLSTSLFIFLHFCCVMLFSDFQTYYFSDLDRQGAKYVIILFVISLILLLAEILFCLIQKKRGSYLILFVSSVLLSLWLIGTHSLFALRYDIHDRLINFFWVLFVITGTILNLFAIISQFLLIKRFKNKISKP